LHALLAGAVNVQVMLARALSVLGEDLPALARGDVGSLSTSAELDELTFGTEVSTQADVKAPAALGVEEAALQKLAHKLWSRAFTSERDARAAERAPADARRDRSRL
jgi:hypothetical protein